MRMGIDQNVGIGAAIHKGCKHGVDRPALLGAGVEFAVGKRTGTTLAKAIVALGIYLLSARNLRHIKTPGVYILASLKQDGSYAMTYQGGSGKKACRTGAHHYCFRGIGR